MVRCLCLLYGAMEYVELENHVLIGFSTVPIVFPCMLFGPYIFIFQSYIFRRSAVRS